MDFLTYHIESSKIKDIDPANDCLRYIANRFELSEEQRYWVAFLYSTNYCAPTTFYMYNEFPDFENVNVGRLQRWWNAHKHQTVFQTDRLKIKTMNKFVETFESYRKLVGGRRQAEVFEQIEYEQSGDSYCNYQSAYNLLSNIRNVGRFTLFIYLEMISVLTDFECEPDRLEWKFADNCRQGMNYHLGHEDDLPYEVLDKEMERLVGYFGSLCDHSNIFNIETTLCAYKKFKHGKRYVGYYLDRQLKEINRMKSLVTTGVAWRVMDEFRTETYKHLNDQQNENNTIDRWLRNWQDLGDEAIDKSIRVS